jgi:hypothetical protein
MQIDLGYNLNPTQPSAGVEMKIGIILLLWIVLIIN